MKDNELISALEALEERAKLAKRKVEFSSALYRLQKRVEQLEEQVKELQNGTNNITKG